MRLLDLIRRRKPTEQTDLDPVLRDVYHFASELRLQSKEIERRLASLKEHLRD